MQTFLDCIIEEQVSLFSVVSWIVEYNRSEMTWVATKTEHHLYS